MADGDVLKLASGHQVFGVPQVTGPQTAIADLNITGLVLLSDVVTAIGTLQTKVNTLLTELRTAGLIAP
jgi:hypothetical protein